MAKAKPANPFVGRSRITHMDLWDQDFMDPAQSRGWAVLKGGGLHGLIAFHQGDESAFVAGNQGPKA